ncbi:hypothetical protein [Streptomyces wuyuanensis]|uniref:hypothetical protein n=1 Tax=Streptomyces wuyuanensis TaxID=1196353 RepID=UPI0034491541
MRAAERARVAREEGNASEAAYWQSIADCVAAAPPFTTEQKARLRGLLLPNEGQQVERRTTAA